MRGTLRARITWLVVGAAVLGAVIPTLAILAVMLWGEASILATALAVVGAAVLVIIVAWPAALRVSQRTAAPIERLAAAATSFAAGEHGNRARSEGPREARLIADAFNKMAEEMSDAIAVLSDEEVRKSQFVSDVSHELRTPLTAIRGAAETLLDGDVAAEDQERFLSTIAMEAERLTRLANDLLTLQRIEGATGELPFRRVDLKDAARRAVAMLEPLIEDRGTAVEVTGNAPLVLGDLDRLQQVVANLIDNATRMVGSGGRVWVELSAEDREAVLRVRDDGPGISDEDLSRLFDRFYRADSSRARSRGGSGLGLAIVKAIVASHGGSIEACNLPEGGALLTVRLPALPAD